MKFFRRAVGFFLACAVCPGIVPVVSSCMAVTDGETLSQVYAALADISVKSASCTLSSEVSEKYVEDSEKRSRGEKITAEGVSSVRGGGETDLFFNLAGGAGLSSDSSPNQSAGAFGYAVILIRDGVVFSDSARWNEVDTAEGDFDKVVADLKNGTRTLKAGGEIVKTKLPLETVMLSNAADSKLLKNFVTLCETKVKTRAFGGYTVEIDVPQTVKKILSRFEAFARDWDADLDMTVSEAFERAEIKEFCNRLCDGISAKELYSLLKSSADGAYPVKELFPAPVGDCSATDYLRGCLASESVYGKVYDHFGTGNTLGGMRLSELLKLHSYDLLEMIENYRNDAVRSLAVKLYGLDTERKWKIDFSAKIKIELGGDFALKSMQVLYDADISSKAQSANATSTCRYEDEMKIEYMPDDRVKLCDLTGVNAEQSKVVYDWSEWTMKRPYRWRDTDEKGGSPNYDWKDGTAEVFINATSRNGYIVITVKAFDGSLTETLVVPGAAQTDRKRLYFFENRTLKREDGTYYTVRFDKAKLVVDVYNGKVNIEYGDSVIGFPIMKELTVIS